MNTVTTTTSFAIAVRTVHGGLIALLALLSRYINNWVAAVIARRERQATIVTLRQLNNRELKDVGLDRWGIDAVLAEARREGGSRDDPYFNLPPR